MRCPSSRGSRGRSRGSRRFGSGEYGIFDAFPDKGGRWEHLTGAVAKGLGKKALSLFGGIPHMNRIGVLAHKLP